MLFLRVTEGADCVILPMVEVVYGQVMDARNKTNQTSLVDITNRDGAGSV